jgi:hypothetical protein
MSATLDRDEVARVLANLWNGALFRAHDPLVAEAAREQSIAFALQVKQAAHALGVVVEFEKAKEAARE